MPIASGRPSRVIAATKAASGRTMKIAMPIAIVAPIRSRDCAAIASAARGAISSSRTPSTSGRDADREPEDEGADEGGEVERVGPVLLLDRRPRRARAGATIGRSSP